MKSTKPAWNQPCGLFYVYSSLPRIARSYSLWHPFWDPAQRVPKSRVLKWQRSLRSCADSQNPSLLLIAKICLATGARWSEPENLQGHQLSKYRITYTKTKGKKNRTVPISQDLYDELPKNRGKLFAPCRKAFERAVKRAGIELPEGQCTHVLRHTFASHFMMNGGNILVLRDILGHADIKMTMIYAHFSPDHLEDAVTKNPLNLI